MKVKPPEVVLNKSGRFAQVRRRPDSIRAAERLEGALHRRNARVLAHGKLRLGCVKNDQLDVLRKAGFDKLFKYETCAAAQVNNRGGFGTACRAHDRGHIVPCDALIRKVPGGRPFSQLSVHMSLAFGFVAHIYYRNESGGQEGQGKFIKHLTDFPGR